MLFVWAKSSREWRINQERAWRIDIAHRQYDERQVFSEIR